MPWWRSAAALFLALYSGAAAEGGHLLVAGISALAALALAGWVALTIVPVLARRTPLRWLTYQIDYKLTREGMVYLGGIFVVALAALNTGNNLLFMVLACLLAGVLISGLLSRLVLSGIDVRLELPEHIFAERAGHGHRRASQYETDDAVVFGVAGERGQTESEKTCRSESRAAHSGPAGLLPAHPAPADRAAKRRADVSAARRLPAGRARVAHEISVWLSSENAPRRIRKSKRWCIPPSSRPRNFTKFFRW